MTIQFQCPQCQSVKSVPDDQGGKLGKCKCGVYLRIPAPGPGKKVAKFEARPTPQTGSEQEELDEKRRILRSSHLASLKEKEKKNKKEPNFYSGAESWSATWLGIGIGVLFFGPCMLWYASVMQDMGFWMLGICASAFWIGVPFLGRWIIRVEWYDALSLVLEKFGFDELDLFESLARFTYVLVTGVATILLLFGVSWTYLFFTDGNRRLPQNSIFAQFWAQQNAVAPAGVDGGDFASGEAAEQPQPDARKLEKLEQDQWAKLKTDFVNALVVNQESTSSLAKTPQIPESWIPCIDVRAKRYTDEYLNRFGQRVKLSLASPSLRFVLQDEVLFDLEMKTNSQLTGRRFQLVPPTASRFLNRIEISEDGEYVLTHISPIDHGNADDNKICLQQVNNSWLHVFPGCSEAYFLPGGTILLGTAGGTYKIVSGSDYSTKREFSGQKLLGVSASRKYLAFASELSDIDTIPFDSNREPLRGKTLELSIYDVESSEMVTSAKYKALASVTHGYFSNDGEKLLLVADEFCTSISLKDGSREKLLATGQKLECIGWVGDGSKFLCMLPRENFAKDSYIRFYDVELGGEVFRVSNDSQKSYDSFDGSYIRSHVEPEKWYRMPISEIEKEATEKGELAREKAISKARLQFAMDWKYSDKVKELMREVASKQYGVEVVADGEETTNPEEYITLEINITQFGKANIKVQVLARTGNGREFWSASDHSDTKGNLQEPFLLEGDDRAEVLMGIVESLNLIATKNPFPGVANDSGFSKISTVSLKDCEVFTSEEQAEDFVRAEPRVIDNSWYADRDGFEVTRLPLLDYSIPKDKTNSESPSLEVVGFVKDKTGPTILLYHPVLGVSALKLAAQSVPNRLEGIDDFVQVQAVPERNELLILKEDQLLLQPYALKKKSLVLALDSKPLRMVVSENGGTLAVATESSVDFYDLEKFRSTPRDPKLKIFEAPYKLGDGQMGLSPNGRWFAGYEKSTKDKGIILHMDSGDEQRFVVSRGAMSVIIDNNGQYQLFDDNARMMRYTPPVLNQRGGFSGVMNTKLEALSSGALSQVGQQVVIGDRTGNIEIRSYPSMTLVEKLWDPGYEPEKKVSNSKMDWSPDGSYFYWIQGERILVWEAPSRVEM